MEVALVEDGVQPVEIGVACYLKGVTEKGDVQVGIAVHFQLSGILTYEPCFQGRIVVDEAALCLAELAAHANVMLIV